MERARRQSLAYAIRGPALSEVIARVSSILRKSACAPSTRPNHNRIKLRQSIALVLWRYPLHRYRRPAAFSGGAGL
jgi:hypothetical protein